MTEQLDKAELLRLSRSFRERRNARRQRLALHVYQCGPRPVFECMLALDAGQPIDDALADFARLDPATCRALGADVMPIPFAVVDGGDDDG